MGCCYYLRMTLVRNSDIGLIQILDDYVATHPEYGWHDNFRHPDGTLEHSLEKIFPNCEKDSDVEFSAEFDASYSWINVVLDACRAMAPQLLNGSFIKIEYEDYTCRTTARYRNGTCTFGKK